jgi:hypothetical protein
MQVPLVLLVRMVSQVSPVELEQRESLVRLARTVGLDKMAVQVNREIQALREVPAHRDKKDRWEMMDHPVQVVVLVSLEILVFPDPLVRRVQQVHLARQAPLAKLARMEAPVSA